MVQSQIIDASYVTIKANAFSRNAEVYEFNVSSKDDFYDLRQSEIEVKLRIKNHDGTNLAANAKVGLINYPVASLFQMAELSLGNEPVAHQGANYGVRGYLEALTAFGRDAQESWLQAGMFYRDSAGQMDTADPAPADVNNVAQPFNKGLKDRVELTSESKLAVLRGKLHLDLFHQPKSLKNNVEMTLRLHRNKDAYVLMSSEANPAFKVEIEDIALICRRQTVSQQIHEGVKDGARYPITRVVMRDYQVTAGGNSYGINQLCRNILPTKVVMGFVRSDAKVGSYTRNPFNFDNFNVSEVAFRIDGQMLNGESLKMNYPDDDITDGYWSLMRMKKNRDEGMVISRKEYKSGYALYAFDLTPSECDDQYRDPKRSGNVEVEFTFRAAIPNNLTLCVYFQFDSEIIINKAGEVVPVFNEI